MNKKGTIELVAAQYIVIGIMSFIVAGASLKSSGNSNFKQKTPDKCSSCVKHGGIQHRDDAP